MHVTPQLTEMYAINHPCPKERLSATLHILNRRVASRQTPSFLSANKKEAKNGFSCGGHLFLPSSSDQLAMDALTKAAILGTESGARFLCGPQNHWYSGGRGINRSSTLSSANWQTTQTPCGRIHRPPAFRCRKHLPRL